MTWTLHHGDCIEWMRSLPDKSVDHVICDPPYEAQAHSKAKRVVGSRRGVRSIRSEPLSFAAMSPELRSAVGSEFARIARRWVLVFCQVEAVHLWRTALAGLSYCRTCVWTKPDGQPQYSGDRPGVGYESIVATHAPGRTRWNGGGRVGVFVHPRMAGSGGGPNPHPTTKPLPLMLEIVSLFTDPGETILDPFAGSGTTGVAALRLGRHFLGAELDATHYATACDRLRAEESGSTLAAARAGQLALLSDDPSPDSGMVAP